MPRIHHFLTRVGKHRFVVRIELWDDNEMHYATRVFVCAEQAKEWRTQVIAALARNLLTLKFNTPSRKAA